MSADSNPRPPKHIPLGAAIVWIGTRDIRALLDSMRAPVSYDGQTPFPPAVLDAQRNRRRFHFVECFSGLKRVCSDGQITATGWPTGSPIEKQITDHEWAKSDFEASGGIISLVVKDGLTYRDVSVPFDQLRTAFPEIEPYGPFLPGALQSEPQEIAPERTGEVGKRRTGPKSDKRESVKAHMLEELRASKITPAALYGEKGEALAARYGVGRTTCNEAREAALSEFNSDN